MQYSVLIIAGAMFLFAVVAIFRHFRVSKATPQLVLVLTLAVLQFVSFVAQLVGGEKNVRLLLAALVALLLSQVLFGWAIHSSRKARLSIVFAPSQPQKVLQRGIFHYIRHPFYTSYFMFWLGTALAAWHWPTAALSLALAGLLLVAARQEEQSFEGTALAADYRAYKTVAGMFLPRFRRLLT